MPSAYIPVDANDAQVQTKPIYGTEKICPRCEVLKPISEFGRRGATGFLQSHCRPCCSNRVRERNGTMTQEQKKAKSDKSLEWRRKKKDAIYAVINKLKEVPCPDCLTSFPPEAMEFDHARGKKFKEVSRMIGQNFSLEDILEEVKKCDVVCANCHRIRTTRRRRQHKAT